MALAMDSRFNPTVSEPHPAHGWVPPWTTALPRIDFFFDLERGDTDLQTRFIDGEGGAFGADYVYIEAAD